MRGILFLLLTAALPAAGLVRMAVLVGNNAGLEDEQVLQFATRDAEQVKAALEQLGGADKDKTFLLLNAPPDKLVSLLKTIRGRIAEQRSKGEKVQLLIYYSGHGSEDALHMNGGRLPVSVIREEFRDIGADLKILIADACFSGALLARKGAILGSPIPVVYKDELKVNGSAILTSSSAGELSQESKELRGSVFTHYFLSAIRGAGDADRDGAVSLWEAYNHTLSGMRRKLAGTAGAVQNPAFDVDLTGSENVVLTRIKLGQAFLSLKGVPEGRYQILEAFHASPVAEAAILDAEGVTMALPKGKYLVYRGETKGGYSGIADLRTAEAVTLGRSHFLPTDPGSFFSKGVPRPVEDPKPYTPFRLTFQPRFYPTFPGRDEEGMALEAGLQADMGPWAAAASWQRVNPLRSGAGVFRFDQEGYSLSGELRRYFPGKGGMAVSAGLRTEMWFLEQRAVMLESGNLGAGRALGTFAAFGIEQRLFRVFRLRINAEPGWFWSYDGGGELRRQFTAPFGLSLGIAP